VIPIARFKTVNMPQVLNSQGENGNCAIGASAVCIDAEQNIARAFDRNRLDVQIVHFGNHTSLLTR
jgi:hypothetical protein